MPAAPRTLQVRCSTWEQVEIFTTRKLRKGRLLSMKVPFEIQNGGKLTLGLELPNQVVIAIDGVVLRASGVDNDPKAKTWIELELVGFTDEVMARIRAMASDAANLPIAAQPPPPRKNMPAVADDLPADERELFQHLSGELRRLRSAPVHDVLGVATDASPDEIRAGWKRLVRRHHPDLVARRGAPAISHLAEELTILSNRAYDRLRAALVAEGRGKVIGPTLASPPGWLVGFEDIASKGPPGPAGERTRRASSPPSDFERRSEGSQVKGHAQPQGAEAFEARARAMLAHGDPNAAREVLAAALVVYPRSKPLRSLYYVASALVALESGELMLATSQLEAAIAHHEQCVEAAQVLDVVRRNGTASVADLRRLFA